MKIDTKNNVNFHFQPEKEQEFVFVKKIKGPEFAPVGRLYHLDLKNTRKFKHLKQDEMVFVKVRWVGDQPVILRRSKDAAMDQINEFIISDVDAQGKSRKFRHTKEAVYFDELSEEEYHQIQAHAEDAFKEEPSLGLEHKIAPLRTQQKVSSQALQAAKKIIQIMLANERNKERSNQRFRKEEEKTVQRHSKEKDEIADNRRLSQRNWEIKKEALNIAPKYPLNGKIKKP